MNTTTRIALITSFHTATNRKGLIAWLKGANAYSGHSRDGMVELVAHSQAVCTQLVEDEVASKVAEQAAMQAAATEAIAIQDAAPVAPQSEEDALAEAEAAFAQAEATKAKPAPKAKKAPKVVDPNKGEKTAAKSRARQPREGTLAKMGAAIQAATPTEDGTLVLTAMDMALAGLGAGWTRTSNRQWTDASSMQARTVAAHGYTATSTRGTLVLVAVVADAEQAAS